MIRALALAILFWGVPRPPAPAQGTAQRLAAITHCQQGFERFIQTPHPHVPDLARACADIYREPACREAMRSPPADPSMFAATIARTCRDAYCPRLSAPLPRLCGRGDLPVPSELASQWPELQQQILALELGPEAARTVPLVPPMRLATIRSVFPRSTDPNALPAK